MVNYSVLTRFATPDTTKAVARLMLGLPAKTKSSGSYPVPILQIGVTGPHLVVSMWLRASTRSVRCRA